MSRVLCRGVATSSTWPYLGIKFKAAAAAAAVAQEVDFPLHLLVLVHGGLFLPVIEEEDGKVQVDQRVGSENEKETKTLQNKTKQLGIAGWWEGLTRPTPQPAHTLWWRSPCPPGWSEPLLGMRINHFILEEKKETQQKKFTIHPSNLWQHCSVATCTCQQHVEFPHAGVEVDGGAEEVECGGVLLHGQVDQAQVVEHLPVKGRKVVGPL